MRKRIPDLVANYGVISTVGSFSQRTRRRSWITLRNAHLWVDGCRKAVTIPTLRILVNCRGQLPTDECPDTWEEVREHGFQPTTIKVYPAWAKYLWDGSGFDCSINEVVSAWFPAPILFEEGALTWAPGTRVWKTPVGVSVARCFEEGHHTALLVREDWLKRTLRKTGCSMVFGWLGEKQLMIRGFYVPRDWTEIDAIASISGSRWSFGERRLKRCSRGK